MKAAFDVILIGGGIAGVSAAARLARSARVVVLEAESYLGVHATGRSAAMYIRNYGNATLRALNDAAAAFYTASDVTSPRGELVFAAVEDLPAFDAYLDGATGLTRLTPKEAADLVPVLRADRLVAAAHEPDAQDIDVDLLLQGFAQQCREAGGRIETGARVSAIRRDGADWVVETARRAFSAPILVNAGGGWADAIAALAGVAPKRIIPYRRSAARVPAPEGVDVSRWPIFMNARETFYCKPDAGALMVSPADEDQVTPHDVWADDMRLAEGIDQFQSFTTVQVTRLLSSWGGMRSFAPDRTPVVGFDPQAKGFFWLAGQGGYGVQTSPALSALTAALVLGRPTELPANVVAALDPKRFT